MLKIFALLLLIGLSACQLDNVLDASDSTGINEVDNADIQLDEIDIKNPNVSRDEIVSVVSNPIAVQPNRRGTIRVVDAETGYGPMPIPIPVTARPSYSTIRPIPIPVTARPSYTTVRPIPIPVTAAPSYTTRPIPIPVTAAPSYTTRPIPIPVTAAPSYTTRPIPIPVTAAPSYTTRPIPIPVTAAPSYTTRPIPIPVTAAPSYTTIRPIPIPVTASPSYTNRPIPIPVTAAPSYQQGSRVVLIPVSSKTARRIPVANFVPGFRVVSAKPISPRRRVFPIRPVAVFPGYPY